MRLPLLPLPLVEGTITRDELRTIDPETGKAQRNYMRGFLCTECSYTATGPQELPYFKILEGGKIRPIY